MEVRAVSERVGREVIAGRKGGASGFREVEDMFVVCLEEGGMDGVGPRCAETGILSWRDGKDAKTGSSVSYLFTHATWDDV